MDITTLVTFFIFIILVSVILYSTIFGYQSYSKYTYGYALQNWCSEDYIEYETIRYQMLGTIPNITKPVLLVDFLIFVLTSYVLFFKFIFLNWGTYEELFGSFNDMFNASIIVVSIVSFILLNLFIILDLAKVKQANDGLRYSSVAAAVVYLMFFAVTWYKLKNAKEIGTQFTVLNTIMFITYMHMITYLTYTYSMTPSYEIEGVFNKWDTWFVLVLLFVPVIFVLILQYSPVGLDGKGLSDFIIISRITEFVVTIIAMYVGVVAYDKLIRSDKDKRYKRALIRLNMIISELLHKDTQSISIDVVLNRIDVAQLHSRDNDYFIKLFSFQQNEDIRVYRTLLPDTMDSVKRNIVDYLIEIYRERLNDYIIGYYIKANSERERSDAFTNALISYDRRHKDDGHNKITELREEFNSYIDNPATINSLLKDNYSRLRKTDQLVKLVIENYNTLNVNDKQNNREQLDALNIGNDVKFYFVGPVDKNTIYDQSSKLKELDQDGNDTFKDEDEKIDELSRVFDILNLPCSYLSYYEGDIDRFKLRLNELDINTNIITQGYIKRLKNVYADIMELGHGENNWIMSIIALIVFAITIYAALIQMHQKTNMSTMIVIIFALIMMFVVFYSIQLLVNNGY